MRRAAIIALWLIGIVSGGFAVFGIMDHYGFMPLVCAIAALGFAGLVGFCALLCNYPAVRRATVITLKIIFCLLAIVGGGFAVYGLMGYYGFSPLVCIIAALAFSGLVGLCVLLYKYPKIGEVLLVGAGIVSGFLIAVALASEFGPLPVIAVIALIVAITNADVISKAAAPVIAFLKTTNPKNAAGIIASVAALIFALAVAAIVIVVIIKSF